MSQTGYIIDKAVKPRTKEAKKYSPRTINLATAAIQFFYLNVLEFRFPTDDLPRMKTGRPLPNSKTTEIYTHVSAKIISKIQSPVAHLNLNKGATLYADKVE